MQIMGYEIPDWAAWLGFGVLAWYMLNKKQRGPDPSFSEQTGVEGDIMSCAAWQRGPSGKVRCMLYEPTCADGKCRVGPAEKPESMKSEKEKDREFNQCVKATAQGISIDTFMLDNNPVLVEFIREVSRLNGGRAVICRPGELGELILVEEIKRREKR